jgi:hypothetical protein
VIPAKTSPKGEISTNGQAGIQCFLYKPQFVTGIQCLLYEPQFVIPAAFSPRESEEGIQCLLCERHWVPAFAEATVL